MPYGSTQYPEVCNQSNRLENDSLSASSQVPEPPLYLVVLLSVLFALIFLFGVAGNLLVTCVVLCGKTLRTSVNYFVISLCVADLLVIIFCMPTAWVDVYAQDVWYFGEAVCKLVPFLENVVAGASVFTILFICVERHKAICQPLRRSSEAVCRVVKPICIIWTLCALISLPFVFFPVFRKSLWVDGTPINVCRHPIRYPWQKAYLVAVPVVFFVLPLAILIALYCMVGKVLVPNSQANTCNMMDESYQLKMKQRRQGLNTVVLIVLIFFASHLPYRVISLWLIFESREVLSQLGLEAYLGILYFARVAFYLNHALNPILYNFVSRKFRAELRRMCCKYQCCCVGRDYFLDDDSLAHNRAMGQLPWTPSHKIPSAHLNDNPGRSRETSCKMVMIHRDEKCVDTVGSSALPSRPGSWTRHKNRPSEWINPRTRSLRRAQRECYTGKLASLMVFLRPTKAGFEIDVDLCKDSNSPSEKQIQI